jgi:hypothetical protein
MAGWDKRTKSEYQLKVEADRDAQPMVTRCAVDGCDWRVEATVGECREQARAHREAEHPELLVAKKRTGKAPKVRREQTGEDKLILRALESNRRRSPSAENRGRAVLLTSEHVEEAHRRNLAGESLAAIIRDSLTVWGYGSEKAAAVALRRELAKHGLESVRHKTVRLSEPQRAVRTTPARRDTGPRRAGHHQGGNFTRGAERRGRAGSEPLIVTPARAEACRRLYEARIPVAAIADLVFERWGYACAKSCETAIYRQIKNLGADLRGNVRACVPDLNRREVLELLEAADEPSIRAVA